MAVKITRPAAEAPLAPEQVLSIMRGSYAQQCQYDPEAEPGIELTFGSSVDDWRAACDLVAWKPLGRALNAWFGIDCSDEQWFAVLEPSQKRSLLDVCELVARTATRPTLVPIEIFGKRCLEAGAFVTLRTALEKAGVPAETLRPSTPLHPWLREHWQHFSEVVEKIAPETLPPVQIEQPLAAKAGYWLLATGLLGALLNLLLNADVLLLSAGAAFLAGILVIFGTSRMQPKRVSFQDLETIGDVCRLVAASIRGRTSG